MGLNTPHEGGKGGAVPTATKRVMPQKYHQTCVLMGLGAEFVM